MQSSKLKNILGLMSAVVVFASFAYGATITGTVAGPDGAPFRVCASSKCEDKNHRHGVV